MSVNIRIGATITALKNACNSAVGYVKQTAKKMQSVTGGMKSIFGGMLAFAGVSAGIAGIKSLVDQCDNLSKSARNIGVTGEELQSLEYAAKSANMPLEKIPMIFSKIKNEAGKALNGDTAGLQKFAALGMSIDDLRNKKPYELFALVAKSINSISDPVERTRAGMALFGEEFDKMQGFLQGFQSSAAELKKSGGIITNEELEAAEKFNQGITDIVTKLQALAVNSGFVSQLADIIDRLKYLSDLYDIVMGKNPQKLPDGYYTRETGVEAAIKAAQKSGNYTPEQIEKMWNARIHYATKADTKKNILGQVVDGYDEESYSMLDKALKDFGLGSMARVKTGYNVSGQFRNSDNWDEGAYKKNSSEEIEAERQKRENRIIEETMQAHIREIAKNKIGANGENRAAVIQDALIAAAQARDKANNTNEHSLPTDLADRIRKNVGEAFDLNVKEAAKKAEEAKKKKEAEEKAAAKRIDEFAEEMVKRAARGKLDEDDEQREQFIREKLEAAEKTKKSPLTDEEAAKVDAAAGELYDQNVASALKAQIASMDKEIKYAQMRLKGKYREAEMEKAVDEAEKQYGSNLTDQQRDEIAQRAGKLYDLAEREREPAGIRQTDITDSLLRVGGYNGSGGSNQALNYQRETVNNLKTIRTGVKRLEDLLAVNSGSRESVFP